MRRPRHEIEAEVPMGGSRSGSQEQTPKVRRQMERICDSIGVAYDDLAEFHLIDGRITAVVYDRNSDGELWRNEFGRVVTKRFDVLVDTATFEGDERDI